jgi:hypothetical protein
VSLQVPGRPDAYSSVFYFAAEAPIPPDSLLGRFVYGDDAYRNARFKIVNRIVKGPWLVRATVGNYGACLLGRALTCRYHKGDDYLEIDVDIGSSAIASAILHLALGAVTSVTIDMGFLVESQSEEELPEKPPIEDMPGQEGDEPPSDDDEADVEDDEFMDADQAARDDTIDDAEQPEL